MKIVVIQGPNLNMLGHREQSIYGGMKLEEIHSQMEAVEIGRASCRERVSSPV